jgi:hypothetical protein
MLTLCVIVEANCKSTKFHKLKKKKKTLTQNRMCTTRFANNSLKQTHAWNHQGKSAYLSSAKYSDEL